MTSDIVDLTWCRLSCACDNTFVTITDGDIFESFGPGVRVHQIMSPVLKEEKLFT